MVLVNELIDERGDIRLWKTSERPVEYVVYDGETSSKPFDKLSTAKDWFDLLAQIK